MRERIFYNNNTCIGLIIAIFCILFCTLIKPTPVQASTSSQLRKVEQQIDEGNQQIMINKALMPQKQKTYDDAVARMGERLRAMYMTGSEGTVAYFLVLKRQKNF